MELSNYQFTIEDISSKCNKSKQSIYKLINQNRELINQNSKRYGRRIRYNQAALNFFLEYYGIESETDSKTASEAPISDAASTSQNNPLLADKAVIKALQDEIETLKNKLAETEAERKDLLQQNGALILTLQQEKQEKMLFLPAPRKGIGETIRGWFQKKEE